MAWTVPKRWSVNELVTAALLNTHARDNLLQSETAVAAAAGDLIYACGVNALTRVAAGSSRATATVASSGSTLEWTHQFYPISIVTTSTSLTSNGVTTTLWESPVVASYLSTCAGLYFTTFATFTNTVSTCTASAELDFFINEPTVSSGLTGFFSDNFGTASIPFSASTRGGWFSAWFTGHAAGCRIVTTQSPRSGCIVSILGAATDTYFREYTASTAGTASTLTLRASNNIGTCSVLTVHYVGLWAVRATS